MLTVWILVILSALFLLGAFIFIALQSREIVRRKADLEEALWIRRNKIPLLIELLNQAHKTGTQEQNLMHLRAKITNPAYEMKESILEERKITGLLTDIFRSLEDSPLFKKEAILLSLKRELSEVHDKINISLNDYNYALQKGRRLLQWPWFKIFSFVLVKGGEKELEAV